MSELKQEKITITGTDKTVEVFQIIKDQDVKRNYSKFVDIVGKDNSLPVIEINEHMLVNAGGVQNVLDSTYRQYGAMMKDQILVVITPDTKIAAAC